MSSVVGEPVVMHEAATRLTALEGRSAGAGGGARLLEAIRSRVTAVAAAHAAEVDRQARFPRETFAALREVGALSAAVPRELGGGGCGMRELATQCALLAQGCAASAMILAMHHIQVACLARHGLSSVPLRDYLATLAREQQLVASVTSEVGTFGDTRSSVCALRRADGRFTLVKEATTISYGAQADALLITCRREPAAAANDQVLVLLRRGDYQLEPTGTWDTLGMRGTCSPGFRLRGGAPLEQIVPGTFADSSAQTMVPYSHILWASLWYGIASDAVARAAGQVRGQARKAPGTVPSAAAPLAKASAELQAVRHHWQAVADEFDALQRRAGAPQALLSIGWALKLNNLKVTVSEAAARIVHQALQITGILGYRNDTAASVGRHYRDVLSAALMVSNERIAGKSASMLLVFKDDPVTMDPVAMDDPAAG
jgi:acyl-CoA dehydrogenase